MNKIKEKNIKVPTGNILILSGQKGLLECLSIGDYGKEKNIKADFLGLSKEINSVSHGALLPLTEKWVITISTQYGCSMNCIFCDVPKVGKGINASCEDMHKQVEQCIALHPEITYTNRLNLHYARMGEPSFNKAVLQHAVELPEKLKTLFSSIHIHPVISTMLPKQNKELTSFLHTWCEIKNNKYNGEAGLQFSMNTTQDEQRKILFSDNSLSFKEISDLSKKLPFPKGRKYTLNFAVTADSIIDPIKLADFFDINKFLVKITPIHRTSSSKIHNLITDKGYESYTPYRDLENKLKEQKFDVIVFIPSIEEDSSRITCGNAILSNKICLDLNNRRNYEKNNNC